MPTNEPPRRKRRGILSIKVIDAYIRNDNQNPKLFVWTASVHRIMAKIAKSKQVLETPH
jgi:hypothetical protein